MSGYQVDLTEQYYTTLVAFLTGIGLCLLYDVLRIFRAAKRFGSISVFCQDVAYCVCVSAVTYIMLLVQCNGTVRFYPLMSELCGFLACRFTVSKLIMIIAKGIISEVNKTVLKPLARIFEKIKAKISVFAKKINYLCKNYLKDTAEMVYNHVKLYRGGVKYESKK